MYIKELNYEEVTNFTKNYSIKSIYQTKEYAAVMNKQKYDSVFLGLIDNNSNILGLSLILIKKEYGFKYAYAPRGFLIDYTNQNLVNNFTSEIKKYLNKKDIMAIKINPIITRNIYDYKHKVKDKNSYYDDIFDNLKKLGYYHLGYNNYFEALKPRFEAIIDLNIPYYMLFNNLKKELRTKIRGAEANGIRVYKGDISNLNYLYFQTKKKYPRDLQYFQDIYAEYSKEKLVDFYYTKLDTKIYLERTQQLYSEYEIKANKMSEYVISNAKANTTKIINKKISYDTMFEKYKKQLVKATNLLRDYPDGIITSAILIIKNYDQVYLLMDGYDKNYKSLNSKQLLLWKVIEKYSKLGYKKFNLGGVSNIDVEDAKYKGLNEFKLSFNPKIYEYIGDLELVTNNTLYFMYRNSRPIIKALKKQDR